MTRRPAHQDDGTVLLLIVGLVVLLVLVVTVVIDVTALFLARKDLLAAADGAALAGAQTLDVERLYAAGITPGPLPLDPAAAENAARDYIRALEGRDGLTLRVAAIDANVTTVRVRLVAELDLPVGGAVTSAVGGPITVTATAAAQSGVVTD